MIEELLRQLRALPIARLEQFGQFSGEMYRKDRPPAGLVWWALAGVVGEVLDDARAEVEQLERALDDEGGIGEQVPGV